MLKPLVRTMARVLAAGERGSPCLAAMVPGPLLTLCGSSACIPEYPCGLGGASSSLILSTDSLLRCGVLANDGSQELDLAQSFQLGTFDVGEGVLDPGEWLNVGDAGSMTDRGLMVPVCEKAGRKVPKDEHEPNAVGELHSLTDWQVSEASEEAELVDFWLVISEGMGDGGFEWVLASWETKPESWEETLLSRWAPEEGIWRRLHILLFLEPVLLGEEGGVW